MKPNYGSFKLGQRVSQSTEFKKGNIPQKPFKKGMTPWIKGKKFVSISTKREDDKKMRILFRGRVQRKVFERDDYTCQLCGIKGQDMQVDHLKSWSKHVESRFDLDNCRTLCAKCHYLITFGRNMPEKVSAWGHNLLGGRHI
jgi:predicted restriction endonuclease